MLHSIRPRDRLMTALSLGVPDRVPVFDFLFQRGVFEATLGRRPESYNARDAVECAQELGLDGIWIPFGGFTGYQPQFLAENVYRDEWGTTYKVTPCSWPIDAPIDYPIKAREDLRWYRRPDPMAAGRLDDILLALEISEGDIAILGGVQGPLTTAWLLAGPGLLFSAFIEDPDFVRSLFALSNRFFSPAADRMIEAGVDAMIVSEDLGCSATGFISVRHFRELVLPSLRELVTGISVPIVLHSCGNLNAYMDDIADLPIAGLHPLQRTGQMDLERLKRDYGDRLCLIGNVDSSATLPYGTPEDVEREVIECLRVAAPGGGYIVASDHSLHDGIPVENIRAMIGAVKKHGRYEALPTS